MTHKSGKVAAMVTRFAGQRLDARYLGYFACFNEQQYYEAHDVLEDLWLLDRRVRRMPYISSPKTTCANIQPSTTPPMWPACWP
jgi:hypothetical protein